MKATQKKLNKVEKEIEVLVKKYQKLHRKLSENSMIEGSRRALILGIWNPENVSFTARVGHKILCNGLHRDLEDQGTSPMSLRDMLGGL